MGCYQIQSHERETDIENYDEMTIEYCIEICRVDDFLYAFLWYAHCSCGHRVPENEAAGKCDRYCEGRKGQICGKDLPDIASVYHIGEHYLALLVKDQERYLA